MADQLALEQDSLILELPSLEDVEHPVLKRAIQRIKDIKSEDRAQVGHNKHHNRFDKRDSEYW